MRMDFPWSLLTAAKKDSNVSNLAQPSPAPETLSLAPSTPGGGPGTRVSWGLDETTRSPQLSSPPSWPPPKLPRYPRQQQLLSGLQVLHFPLVIGLTGRAHGTCPGALGVTRGKNSNWLCPHCTAPSQRSPENNSTGHDLELAHHARNGAWHPAVAQEMLGGCIPSQRLGVVVDREFLRLLQVFVLEKPRFFRSVVFKNFFSSRWFKEQIKVLERPRWHHLDRL